MKKTETEFHARLYDLNYNYPHGITTWGHCKTIGCSNSARGSRQCSECCECALADLVGAEIAKELHNAERKRFYWVNHSLMYLKKKDK